MLANLTTFTLAHVAISLVGIISGFVMLYGLLTAKRFEATTALFLATTVATSVTGFFFPVHHFMPSHGVGIISLLVLPIAYYARYGRHLLGNWRWTYVVAAMVSLYLNVFVLVVQSFLKVPALRALAPTGSEPPFAVAQGVVLVAFVVLTILAGRRFRVERTVRVERLVSV